ncbi:MAG: hypothetical protein IT307_03675 [Chloroflexi bacterium]|nr:hypothetical protein [Chloroflexota bacterium]
MANPVCPECGHAENVRKVSAVYAEQQPRSELRTTLAPPEIPYRPGAGQETWMTVFCIVGIFVGLPAFLIGALPGALIGAAIGGLIDHWRAEKQSTEWLARFRPIVDERKRLCDRLYYCNKHDLILGADDGQAWTPQRLSLAMKVTQMRE